MIFNCINATVTNTGKCIIHNNKSITRNDSSMSIYNKNGKKCSFCRRRCLGLRSCKCKKYCSYCFAICVWSEVNDYVCNDCCNKDHIHDSYNLECAHDVNINCHRKNCDGYAYYGCYGIILFCAVHSDYVFDIDMDTTCKQLYCFKLVVDDKQRCYDHTSNKIRARIQYMIKN